MLGLFRRARTRSAAPRPRATLRLEALEWRDQPSVTPLGDAVLGAHSFVANSGRPVPNAPPAIVNFQAEQLANGLFLITGKVVDEAPGGLVVTFGGGTSAYGQTVTATPDGTFSTTVQLRTDGTDSGFLTATTVDAQGLASRQVQVFLDPTPA